MFTRCFLLVFPSVFFIQAVSGCEIDRGFSSLKPYMNQHYRQLPDTRADQVVFKAITKEQLNRHKQYPTYVLEQDQDCNLYWTKKMPPPLLSVKLSTQEEFDNAAQARRRFFASGNVLTEVRRMTTGRGEKTLTYKRVFTETEMTLTMTIQFGK